MGQRSWLAGTKVLLPRGKSRESLDPPNPNRLTGSGDTGLVHHVPAAVFRRLVAARAVVKVQSGKSPGINKRWITSTTTNAGSTSPASAWSRVSGKYGVPAVWASAACAAATWPATASAKAKLPCIPTCAWSKPKGGAESANLHYLHEPPRICPPPTRRVWPVIWLAPVPHKNSIAVATSAGSSSPPNRLSAAPVSPEARDDVPPRNSAPHRRPGVRLRSACSPRLRR